MSFIASLEPKLEIMKGQPLIRTNASHTDPTTDARRGSATPKPTPEADVPPTKTELEAEVAAEVSAQPETAVKAEDHEQNRHTGPSAEPDRSVRPSTERQNSERPASEPGASKKEDTEEEKAAAAAAAKEQQLQRAETIL